MQNTAQQKELSGCKQKPVAETAKQPAAPVTYNLDGRTYIVKPVFKENSAQTLSDALLRLMRSDLETS